MRHLLDARALCLARTGAAFGLLLVACTGQVQPETAASGESTPSPSGAPTAKTGAPSALPPVAVVPVVPPSACALPAAAPAPLRRLSRTEYENTLRDLLGVTVASTAALPADRRELGFDNNVEALATSPLLLDKLRLSAEEAVANLKDVSRLLPCAPAGQEPSCADRFVRTFGLRAFRRPLDDGEASRFAKLHAEVRTREGFEGATRAVIEAMLQAPQFLYRSELGPASATYDVASRLSFFLWGSMPDEPLLQAAADGRLTSRTQIAGEVVRMVADRRARRSVAHFHALWLHLDDLADTTKDPALYPWFDENVLASLRRGTETYLDKIVFEEGGRYDVLLTGAFTYADRLIGSRYYGVSVAEGKIDRVPLQPARSGGLLNQPALLAMLAKDHESSPVQRGVFVREQLLCQVIPPPPADVNTELPALKPGESTRTRFAAHARDPVCAGCHRMIDPIGYGLERFDATGRWRDKDQGVEIDDRGELVDVGDASGPFQGVRQLAERIAGSGTGRSCMVRQWLRYALGRDVDQQDACLLRTLEDAFTSSAGDIRTFIAQLATHHALERSPR